MIDVQKGELRLRVQEEEVTFNVFNGIKHPHDTDSCFRVDMLEAIVSSQLVPSEPLETSLTHITFTLMKMRQFKSMSNGWILSAQIEESILNLWELA